MEENTKKEEKKKNRKPVDKMKILQTIIALVVIVFMVFSVCGTLIYYLINSAM